MTRVVLVDDQELVRSGLRMILTAEDDLDVVGEAADGLDAVDLYLVHWPLLITYLVLRDRVPTSVLVRTARETVDAASRAG